jgi:hypothetical protein
MAAAAKAARWCAAPGWEDCASVDDGDVQRFWSVGGVSGEGDEDDEEES